MDIKKYKISSHCEGCSQDGCDGYFDRIDRDKCWKPSYETLESQLQLINEINKKLVVALRDEIYEFKTITWYCKYCHQRHDLGHKKECKYYELDTMSLNKLQ